jgi:hypothetical protein
MGLADGLETAAVNPGPTPGCGPGALAQVPSRVDGPARTTPRWWGRPGVSRRRSRAAVGATVRPRARMSACRADDALPPLAAHGGHAGCAKSGARPVRSCRDPRGLFGSAGRPSEIEITALRRQARLQLAHSGWGPVATSSGSRTLRLVPEGRSCRDSRGGAHLPIGTPGSRRSDQGDPVEPPRPGRAGRITQGTSPPVRAQPY